MSYQRERDEFIRIAAEEGLSLGVTRKLLRYASTLHRLAVAQCNGDWPFNGDRDRPSPAHVNVSQGLTSADLRERWDKRYTTCPKCEASGVAKSAMRRSVYMNEGNGGRKYFRLECPDCRTGELVKAALPAGYQAKLGGDPRGAVLKIVVPSGRTNDWGREGIYVPVRQR